MDRQHLKRPKREMHPRNIFRTPPDYTALAIKYEYFRKVCKLELTGKVRVDYKNENALRALTKVLLEEFFQIENVEFAPGSLVPTVPLRLNYILWLEDLMKLLPANENENENTIHGIDIGCGSSCIYSLLCAKKNTWHMYALELNASNVEYAQRNIENNKLQDLVKVIHQTNAQHIFTDLIEAECSMDRKFHFCLCNPPFYDSTLPDPFHGNTRNIDKRTPPSNCRTGNSDELACEGGEVQFVKRIIEESLQRKDGISIFTSMLGHKTSLLTIITHLTSLEIANYCTTEFIQGKTTRWAIAWSFMDAIILNQCKT